MLSEKRKLQKITHTLKHKTIILYHLGMHE